MCQRETGTVITVIFMGRREVCWLSACFVLRGVEL